MENHVPRGGKLRIVIVTRVSAPGPGRQDPRSVEDQESMIREWIQRHISEPHSISVLAGSGSGENLDRKEYQDLIELVKNRGCDLIITEDLGRIARRIDVHTFCETCVDHDVRVIAINDHVDTDEDGWQDRSFFSSWHHERSNRDTSDRIKRTHRSRFLNGGCASFAIFGYIKPPGAKTDMDWRKDPDAEPIYQEWFARLDRGESYAEIADWLNERKVPLGPYARSKRWNARRVRGVTHNPLLKGERYRNKMVSKRDSRGKYRTQRADPGQLLTREVPHLAFIEPEEYDRIIAKLNERNACYRREKDAGDPREGVPRKRTRFPSQLTYCGVCGRRLILGGHGAKGHLVCSGVRVYECWNAATFDGDLAARRIANVVLETFTKLPDFDSTLLEEVNRAAAQLDRSRTARIDEISRDLERLGREIENLIAFITAGQSSSAVADKLQALESQQRLLIAERKNLERQPSRQIEIPDLGELRRLARHACQDLAVDDWEFYKRMQLVVPRIEVHPVKPLDGGMTVLRACLRIHPAGWLEDPRSRQALDSSLATLRVIDLFDPPQRIAFGRQAAELHDQGLWFHQIAAKLGISKSAACEAAKFYRHMRQLGRTDPYIPIQDASEMEGQIRRHRHPRFQFSPLPEPTRIPYQPQ